MANDHSSVNKPKQRTAFPPNYIHSLDSAHMMLTARACQKEGISFAGVHDSYWTHAGTVDDMNRILRDMVRPLPSTRLASLTSSFPSLWRCTGSPCFSSCTQASSKSVRTLSSGTLRPAAAWTWRLCGAARTFSLDVSMSRCENECAADRRSPSLHGAWLPWTVAG